MTTDEQSIHTLVQELEAAWNTSDSVALADHFVEDAQFIHIFGGHLDGRTAIEASHRGILNGIYKGSRADWKVRNIRFLKPDVAVVFTNATIRLAEGAGPGEINSRPTFVATKENNRWRIHAFQNTRITELPPQLASRA